MKTEIRHLEFRKKLIKGLDKAYERLIKFKKEKKTELVIMKDGKIVKIKPEDLTKPAY